jgi:MerR family transcriptional regulator, thiopeptide resistance regulator
MSPVAMKVGALARQTGISVRTLHYYEEIDLLTPSRRTDSGHRLYTADDIARLQQIRSLQHLGLSLDEVRACLARGDLSARAVLDQHLARVREQIALLGELQARLEGLSRVLTTTGNGSVEELLSILEVMTRMEKHYTPEQMEWFKARREQVGEERIRQVEAEWPTLIARVRAEMEAGTDPASPTVRHLARRWKALVEEFTGGNPEIGQAVRRMYEQEPEMRRRSGIDMAMSDYVNRALAAAGETL